MFVLSESVKRDFQITKRDLWGLNEGARWAFFAIFIVIILLAILGTMRVNKKRSGHGLQPIYGTRWMTPPSYIQSQTQYNQPSRRDETMPDSYVPTYSEQANEQDMGHYDNQGNFHANPNAKASTPFRFNSDSDSVTHPDATHNRTGSTTDGVPINELPTHNEEDEDLADISRPVGPPPRTTTTESFAPPTGPPPSGEPSSSTPISEIEPPQGPPPSGATAGNPVANHSNASKESTTQQHQTEVGSSSSDVNRNP